MRILLATNGSESSLKAENFAFDFFKGLPVGELVVVSVVRITGVLDSEEYTKAVEEQKKMYLAHQADVEERALAAGIKKVKKVIAYGSRPANIINIAKHEEVAYIFLGAKKRYPFLNLKRSVYDRVAEAAECPVIIVR